MKVFLLKTVSTNLSKTFSGYCQDVAIRPMSSSASRIVTSERDEQKSFTLVSVGGPEGACGPPMSAMGVILITGKLHRPRTLKEGSRTLFWFCELKNKTKTKENQVHLRSPQMTEKMTHSIECIHSPATCPTLTVGITWGL